MAERRALAGRRPHRAGRLPQPVAGDDPRPDGPVGVRGGGPQLALAARRGREVRRAAASTRWPSWAAAPTRTSGPRSTPTCSAGRSARWPTRCWPTCAGPACSPCWPSAGSPSATCPAMVEVEAHLRAGPGDRRRVRPPVRGVRHPLQADQGHLQAAEPLLSAPSAWSAPTSPCGAMRRSRSSSTRTGCAGSPRPTARRSPRPNPSRTSSSTGSSPDEVLDRGGCPRHRIRAEERAWVVTQDVNSVKRGLNAGLVSRPHDPPGAHPVQLGGVPRLPGEP